MVHRRPGPAPQAAKREQFARLIARGLPLPVSFCDKASPWQRPSNDNTNGLLRQYFPKDSDLSLHSPEQLAAVAAELINRLRTTLGWDTPTARLGAWLPGSADHD